MRRTPSFSRATLFSIPLASLSLGAWLSSYQPGVWLTGWLAFSLLLALGFLSLVALWRWAGGGRALAWMVVLAFALRLAAGAVLHLGLPVFGYDDADDRAGFVFTDAHRRDDQAWELAASDEPIISAFNKQFHTDQYGGLLAWSAFLYRYLSPDAHRPLLLILFSALIAALGLPFFWRAAEYAFDRQIALIAGWIMALYPESILLGSAAMREPYLITFTAMSLWGFIGHRARVRPAWQNWSWLASGLAGMLLVSPVVALVTLVGLGGWYWLAGAHRRGSWLVLVAALLVFVAGVFLLTWALNRQGIFSGGPLGVVGSWFREAVKWDVYQLERGSGWVQKLFDEMPEWMRLPFVTIYGVLQPVLPAVFIEPTLPVFRAIGIARALGWYLMLPLLAFAFIAAWKAGPARERRLWLWIITLSWLWITLAALRGGGDQWDNPRYRVILLLWQALAAGYALASYRLESDPWLGRILLIEGIFLAFFTQWYLERYFYIGKEIDFKYLVALIIGSSLIVLVGGAWWDRRRAKKRA